MSDAPPPLPPSPGDSPLPATPPARRGKGGRPKIDPAAVRRSTIGVRVSAAEYDALRTRAEQMGLTPAQFLRHAALTRRLPSPPVPAVNRDEYAKLGRLAGNLNQLVRRANLGQHVILTDPLVKLLRAELNDLRQALLGLRGEHPMIAKAVKGTGFKGAVSYDLDPRKARFLTPIWPGKPPPNSRPSSRRFGICGPASAKPSYTSP